MQTSAFPFAWFSVVVVVAAATDPALHPPAHCLCIFDVDRVLTGAQGKSSECPNAKVQKGVPDTAYGGGTLMLSEAGSNLGKTFCAKCFHGIVGAGELSGAVSAERDVIFNNVVGPANMTLTSEWQDFYPHSQTFESSLVLGWPDGRKHIAVKNIIDWFMNEKNIFIPDEQVHFFDDRLINIEQFEGSGYNARQVSCSSRDPHDGNVIGLCGAALDEIVRAKGVSTCVSRNKVFV